MKESLLNLTELKTRLKGQSIVTRFAPSPTGFLHLGHVAHGIFVWGLAKALNAKVCLRIEDHDRQRSKDFYAIEIIEDIKNLGFDFSVDSNFLMKNANLIQSKNLKVYENTMKNLNSRGLVYGCRCSRKVIKLRLEKNGGLSENSIYDGFCRDKGYDVSKEKQTLRLRVNSTKKYFWDAALGERNEEVLSGFNDIALKDLSGNYSYQFAVVVDDLRHQINLIIRGEDLLSSTAIQLYLRDLVSPNSVKPLFVHHPLIKNKDSDKKLSKSDNDFSLQNLKAEGLSPELILGKAAYEVGIINNCRALSINELGNIFRKK